MQDYWNVIRYTYGRKNHLLWILGVILPVLISVFLMALFDSRTPLRLPVGVVVQDDSPLAHRVIRHLQSNATIRVTHFCVDLPSCEKAMRQGQIFATVHIPPRLEKRVFRGEAPGVPVYLNGQSLVAYNMLYKEIRGILTQEGAGIEKRNPKDPITTQLHAIHNPSLDYLAFLGLSMLAAVFHLASMVVAVYLVGEPLRDRTADTLLQLTHNNPIRALMARLLPALVVLWLLNLFFAVWIRYRTHLSLAPTEFFLLALGTFFMISAAMAAGMAWTALSGNMRIASSTAGVIGGPAFAFSGITFPLISMPWPVQLYAQLLPLTHFLEIQNHLLFADMGHLASVQSILILAGMTFAWAMVGIPLLCKRFRQPHFHGGHREEPFG